MAAISLLRSSATASLSFTPLNTAKLTGGGGLCFAPLSGNNPTCGLSFASSVSSSIRIVKAPGKQRRGTAAVSYAAAALIAPQTALWISTICSALLMIIKGTAIQRSFLVPFFALQAPVSVISWMKGEYGTWTAFLALLVRLFYFIPGELELPFITLLLVIVAPYQTMNLRGSQAGAIISFAIAAFLAFQHFSRAGSLRRAFDQGSIIASIATICITIIPCFFLLI